MTDPITTREAGYPAMRNPQRPRCDYCRAKLTLAVVRRFFFGQRVAWICRNCDSWERA